jgi:hypothetical protein
MSMQFAIICDIKYPKKKFLVNEFFGPKGRVKGRFELITSAS